MYFIHIYKILKSQNLNTWILKFKKFIQKINLKNSTIIFQKKKERNNLFLYFQKIKLKV